MFEQLKKQYINSFDTKVKNLKQALEDENLQALTFLVHQLAGSSGSYGLVDISELCSNIESMLLNQTEINATVDKKVRLLIELMKNHSI